MGNENWKERADNYLEKEREFYDKHPDLLKLEIFILDRIDPWRNNMWRIIYDYYEALRNFTFDYYNKRPQMPLFYDVWRIWYHMPQFTDLIKDDDVELKGESYRGK